MIGLGLRGGLATVAHRPGDGGRIVALCDVDPEAIGRAQSWFADEVRTASSYVDVFTDDVDAVIVATPDHTHEEIAVAALEAGKAVYLEKPMATTVEGCDRILAAAKASRSRLYVGHNMRHFPFVLTMRDLIRRGAIGEVKAAWVRHFVGYGGVFYFQDWHADRRNTTGLLLQKGAHDIDIVHWLCGGYTRRVNAMGALTFYDRPTTRQPTLHEVVDVEDISMVNLELDNGVLATYSQCHFTPDYWRNYTVIGTEGRIENFGDTEGVIRHWSGLSGYDPDGAHQIPFGATAGGHGGADPAIMAEFLRFARDGGATNTSPVAARMAVATGVTATQSLRSGGQPLDVPGLDPELAAYFDAGQPGSSPAGRDA